MSAVLARHQEWLFEAITGAAPQTRAGRILGGAAVPADIGLEVYRHAFRSRLRDCLADDFSAVKKVVGEASFAVLANAYISEFPPRASTLNRYGSQFPGWLRHSAARLPLHLPQRTHVVELAHLEWALVEAIHAPSATSMTRTALAKLPQDGWAKVRLVPVPSLRMKGFTWSINDSYAAFLAQRSVASKPQRHTGAVVVLRRASGLRRHQLDFVAARLLAKLCAGAQISRALAGFPLTTRLPFRRHFPGGWRANFLAATIKRRLRHFHRYCFYGGGAGVKLHPIGDHTP